MAGPSRRTRLVVAVAMTMWAVLQAATLVVAAVRGGEPSDAFRYVYTGMLTMVLVALTVVAWRWVAGGRPGPSPAYVRHADRTYAVGGDRGAAHRPPPPRPRGARAATGPLVSGQTPQAGASLDSNSWPSSKPWRRYTRRATSLLA